jgi:foldase protein PrsA
MRQPFRYVVLLSALLVAPTLSACGGDESVPDDAVVKIGSDTIKKSAFDHQFTVFARQQATASGAEPGPVPDAPNFTKCIAYKKKTAAKPAKGQPAPTDATYKAQCQQQYAASRDQAMQFLISSAWVEGESADRGLKLSDAGLKKIFDKQRAQGFTSADDYRNFLKQTGYSQEDLLYRVKIQQLTGKLQAQVLAGTNTVSDAQIANYYNQNKSKFAIPEKRDIRVVLTKTEDQALKAKAALEAGQSWKDVALKYSIDRNSRTDGGLVKGIGKGTQEKSLGAALFSAKKGEIAGPTKTKYGYFVIKVEKITPGQQPSLKQVEATIKQALIKQQQETKMGAFTKDFQKKWKDRTVCQKGYQMQDCKNAPKVQPSTPAPAAPQSSTAAPSGTSTAGAGAASGNATTNK